MDANISVVLVALVNTIGACVVAYIRRKRRARNVSPDSEPVESDLESSDKEGEG